MIFTSSTFFLEGISGDISRKRKSNNRSVMPLDVRGRTRATLKCTMCVGQHLLRWFHDHRSSAPASKEVGNHVNSLRTWDRAL